MDITDNKELLEKLQDSETRREAFNLVVQQYSKQLYYHIRRMVVDHDDANDLVQDTFIKAWTNLDKFRFDSAIYTWIFRIATNTCLNFIDRQKRKFTFSALSYEDDLASKIESDPYFDGDEIQVQQQKAILKTPENKNYSKTRAGL